MPNPEPNPRPLKQLEIICIMVAAMPGILLVTGGRVQTHAQAIFRLSVFLVGLLGYLAVKLYQRSRR